MNDMTPMPAARAIELDEVFAHAPAVVWRALTDPALIGRWLMEPTGFAPVEGTRFTYRTKPAGAWDGLIRCEVLEVVPGRRLVYSWRSGDAGNVGYGAPLDTVVTWTLSPEAGGTRVRIVHSGFVLPRNEVAHANMSEGWRKVVRNLDAIAAAPDPSTNPN